MTDCVNIFSGQNTKKALYLTSLTIFLLYLVFLCPTVYNGDSPLLYTSAFSLGPAHPPGYPLYVLLGKITTFIPLGSIAYKLNLFSALCGVLTAFFVFKSVYLITEDITASIFSSLLSSLLPFVWLESTKAEVYTLNSVFLVLIFYLGIRFLQEGFDRRLLFLSSFILGLGMGNHHTIGFMLFPLIFLYIAGVKERKIRTALICLLFFSLGISIYLLSYIRSLKWSSEGVIFTYSDSSTFKRFLITFFRKEYGSSIPVLRGPTHNPLNLLLGAYNTIRYFIWKEMGFYSLLCLFSIPFLWRKKSLLSYSLISLVSYGVVLSGMVFAFKEPDEKLFLLNSYMLPVAYLLVINAGIGLSYILRLIRGKFVFRPLAIGVVLLPFVFNLPQNLKENNLSEYWLAEDSSNNLLQSLPPKSVVLSSSDATYFPLFYKSLIERRRDDVLILLSDKGGILTQVNPKWKYKSLFPDLPAGKLFNEVDASYVSRGRLFAYNIFNISDKVKGYFSAFPYIQCFRLFPKEYKYDEKQITEDFKRAIGLFVYERALKEKANDLFSSELKMYYFITLTHYAYILKNEGDFFSKNIYEDSLKLITGGGLRYYMDYLELAGNKEEINSFITSIEPYAEKYLEVRLLSSALKQRFLTP